MKKKVNVTLEEETYNRIKSYAEADRRSAATEMALILELYRPGMIPGISVIAPGVMPTPAEQIIQQPFVYTPTITTATQTQAQTTTTELKGLAKEEYARKLMAEAKTEKALERQEQQGQGRILSPEEEQLQKQKLELQKQKMQEKRDSLIRDKAIELDLEDAEDYNEDWLLDEYFGLDYYNAKLDERDKGVPNPYTNPPKSIDELYKYMNELKQIEIKEKEEEDRRDALPHDIDDYDYKSEDFIQEVNRLQGVWVERGSSNTSYDDEDFNILFNYYFRKGLYHDFEERMNHPYYAFSDDDMQDLQNAFNRTDIDIDYINALMCGDGYSYRSSHNKKSYFEEHQEERAEWQRIIDESKKKRTEI